VGQGQPIQPFHRRETSLAERVLLARFFDPKADVIAGVLFSIFGHSIALLQVDQMRMLSLL
jgi:hypothetical protein